jgi:hypothetical protein
MKELLTLGGEHHGIVDGGWLMMTTAMNRPIRSLAQWLRLIKCDYSFFLIFFSVKEYLCNGGRENGGMWDPQARGARPGGWAHPLSSWLMGAPSSRS